MSRGRGPDKGLRKGTPRIGKRAEGQTPVDDKPGAIRRDRALVLLLEGKSPRAVAREMKISNTTIYNWMNRPDFSDRLARGQAEQVEAARRKLVSGAEDAAQALVDIAAGKSARLDSAQVQAIRALLDRVGLVGVTGLTVQGKVSVDLPDLRALTPEQLAALAAEEDS